MKFLQAMILVSIMAVPSFGIEPISKVTLPMEVREELQVVDSNIPDEIKGKVWNRWTSENFTVLSLNDIQAQYLHKHLELVKVWVYSRWGLYDIPFSAECKLIGVDDPDLFFKMFNIRNTYVEIRRDEQGNIKESVIFVLINDSPSHTVPVPLTQVCMAEFAQSYQEKIPWCFRRGIALLNGSLGQIRGDFNEFNPIVQANKPVYFTEGMFVISKEEWLNLGTENKRIFDHCSMTLCLMIRKEFGENKFHWFMKTVSDKNVEVAVKDVLRFDSIEEFDRTFRRYMIDITRDIVDGKTPDDYLQIMEPKSD